VINDNKLIEDKTSIGLIYRGSGAGVKMQKITALKHALRLVLKLKSNISDL
jgi:hypothetical protein